MNNNLTDALLKAHNDLLTAIGEYNILVDKWCKEHPDAESNPRRVYWGYNDEIDA